MKGGDARELLKQGLLAGGAFALASSACYIVNDLCDAPQDRMHPRKKSRPIASGAVPAGVAWVMMVLLLIAAGAMVALVRPGGRSGLTAVLGLYVVNVLAYSAFLRRVVMADVVSLAMGFVLRVIGGCVAVSIAPTTWLLNCSLFLAMFLAFGKRLGERRGAESQGFDAAQVRGVQAKYTDHLLRMAVVVTAVATLVSYAAYIQSREVDFAFAAWGMPAGFNWLWITIIPATFCLLRSVTLVERGTYDDPTEMFLRDRALLPGAALFAAASAAVMVLRMNQVAGVP
jgi:decaprenyl-phosphate phosphoribosyltransferase